MAYTPWFRSPFTDITGSLINHQFYGRCGELEMKLVDCMEAYGLTRAVEKCDTLIHDFNECAGQQKQFKRFLAMRKERHRQYKDGERTKEDLYAPPPTQDSL